MRIRRRSAALVAWLLTVPCLAGSPDYDAFSEADGYIATDQHQIAVWAVVRDQGQLEAVYRDVTRGNLRAIHVFEQLEATFSASGRRLAEQISQPPCLIPGFRELSGMCIPGWTGLSYLSQDKPGGIRLRQVVFGAFTARARERGLQNQLVLSAASGLISIELARAALAEANVTAAVTRIPEAARAPEFRSARTAGRGVDGLRSIGNGTSESAAGLRYGPGGAEGNRVAHVLEHAADIPTRAGAHGVFSGRGNLISMIDDAYRLAQNGGAGVSVVQQGSRTVYTVDMGRNVGFIGGQVGAAMGNPAASHVRLVLEGTNVITAFPVLP